MILPEAAITGPPEAGVTVGLLPRRLSRWPVGRVEKADCANVAFPQQRLPFANTKL
jgi:hypothetical protein